jgi:hypothetical protein
VALPPKPSQFSSNAVVSVSAAVVQVPLTALVPLQPPEAVHEFARVEVQVSVDVPPLVIVVGDAARATVGANPVTTTSVDWVVVPPGPVHVNV